MDFKIQESKVVLPEPRKPERRVTGRRVSAGDSTVAFSWVSDMAMGMLASGLDVVAIDSRVSGLENKRWAIDERGKVKESGLDPIYPSSR